MSGERDRRLFGRPPLLRVRVRPQGFQIVESEERVSEIEGYVLAWKAIRKLFLDGVLSCQSNDGIVARDSNTECEKCRHPLCRPQIRLRLADRHVHYLLDLAVSSAQNFLAVESAMVAERFRLAEVELRLTVKNRAYFGEVCFERA
jgi:hypothetical protein